MIEILSTVSGKIHTDDTIKPGCWVRLVLPTDEELDYVCGKLGLNTSDLKILLDEEELPRFEQEDDYTLILVDTPYKSDAEDITSYQTIPAGFVLMKDCIVTISLRRNPVLDAFADGKYKNLSTEKRERFLLRFLF